MTFHVVATSDLGCHVVPRGFKTDHRLCSPMQPTPLSWLTGLGVAGSKHVSPQAGAGTSL